MNLSKIVRKVISEETGTRGLNYADQYDILEKGRKNCPTFKSAIGDRPVKNLSKSDMVKFKDLGTPEEAAYISSAIDKSGSIRMFFAIQDPEVTDKKSFLTYYVQPGKIPAKYKQGWGYDCAYMQETSELGKDTLSADQRARLDDFLYTNKNNYAEFVEKGSQQEYERVPYNQLEYTDGRKVLPDYKGNGFVFKRSRLANVLQDKFNQMDIALTGNGFTRIEPLNAQSAEANAGFFLKDIAKDLPALAELARTSPNTKVWPIEGTLVIPNRDVCKTAIKHLHKCSKATAMTTECTTNLWKNKMLALQCGDKNFIGGRLGIGNEFDELLIDGGRFGLANLKTARQAGFESKSEEKPSGPNLSIKENISYVVSKALNEEYKRRNFRY